jgi:hypothetical protein
MERVQRGAVRRVLRREERAAVRIADPIEWKRDPRAVPGVHPESAAIPHADQPHGLAGGARHDDAAALHAIGRALGAVDGEAEEDAVVGAHEFDQVVEDAFAPARTRRGGAAAERDVVTLV